MAVKTGPTIKNVIRGDTRRVNLLFLQSDKVTPVDLTGGTVKFTVNSSDNPASDSSKAFQKTASSGFTDATHGQHTFELTPTDTDIDPGVYWYDAQFTDSLGAKLSAFRGKFVVQSDITRT